MPQNKHRLERVPGICRQIYFFLALSEKSERAELSVGVAVVDVDGVVGDLDGVGLLVDAVEGVVAKQVLWKGIYQVNVM